LARPKDSTTADFPTPGLPHKQVGTLARTAAAKDRIIGVDE